MTVLRVLGCALALLAWATSAHAQTVPAGGGSSFVGSSCITISSGTISIPVTCNPTLAGATLTGTLAMGAAGITFNADSTLISDAANTLALRNGTNLQTLRVYGTFTSASVYHRLAFYDTGGGTTIAIEAQSAGGGSRALKLRASASNIVLTDVNDATMAQFLSTGFTPVTILQANLGTPANGSLVYCSDCTIANPCAGGGTGALAKRLNGVWVCN